MNRPGFTEGSTWEAEPIPNRHVARIETHGSAYDSDGRVGYHCDRPGVLTHQHPCTRWRGLQVWRHREESSCRLDSESLRSATASPKASRAEPILHTDWSFPAIVARSLGLSVPGEFRLPGFPGTGLPFNIDAFRWRASERLGSSIEASEWVFRFLDVFPEFRDGVEDIYERGAVAGTTWRAS